MAAILNLSGVGSAYLRVSDDRQDHERQRQSIGEWQSRHGVTISPENYYIDLGWSRAKAKFRPEFQRLLRDVREGRIQWVVVDRPDRFGTANKFELFHYLYQLTESGCRLYTVDERELTSLDVADSLHVHLDADQSERELQEKSIRVLEAMRQRASRGTWMGGRIPYACDVVCFRLRGEEMVPQWRVKIVRNDLKVKIEADGRRREYHGNSNFPPTEQGEILQLRPTEDQPLLDAVLWLFKKYDGESTNYNLLARQANEAGLPPPAYSQEWDGNHVRRILNHPAYIGRPAWNRNTSGDYSEWSKGIRRPKKPNQPMREHAPEDWITAEEPLFNPVVPLDLFNRVQTKLAGRDKGKRSPKAAALWLSGLVYCARCGQPMNGAAKYSKGPAYMCSTYVKLHKDRSKACPCQVNAVTHEALEKYLREWLGDAGIQVTDLAAAAYIKGSERIDAFRSAFERAEEAKRKMMSRGGSNAADDGHDEILIEGYRRLFDGDKPKLQARLDQLEGEHTDTSKAWQTAPTMRSKEKFRVRLVELEAEMQDIEEKLRDATDELATATAEAVRLLLAWEEASNALESETTARVKRASIEKVLDRIILTFEDTGLARPTNILKSVDIVPVNSQGRENSGACSGIRWS